MKKVLFPGSFDPPTWGHIDIIKRAAKLFDQLIVGIGENLKKEKNLFTLQEKIEGLKSEVGHLPNVEIMGITGLTVEFAKKQNIHFLLRSLRSSQDLELEMQMARANNTLTGIETLFLMAKEETSMISSTLIRELAMHKAPLKQFIPSYFENLLHSRMKS